MKRLAQARDGLGGRILPQHYLGNIARQTFGTDKYDCRNENQRKKRRRYSGDDETKHRQPHDQSPFVGLEATHLGSVFTDLTIRFLRS